MPREGFELDLLRSAGLKGMSLVGAGARAGAAAAQRARRLAHRLAAPAAAGDWRRRIQLGPGRAGGGAAAASRRCCSSRTRCPGLPTACWRRSSAPRRSPTSRRCRTSGGGALSQATRFVPSSLTDARRGAGTMRPAEDSDLWRLPGRARDQHGHGGGGAEAGSPPRRAGSHASDRRTRSGTRPGRLPARRPRGPGRAVPLRPWTAR